MEIEGDTESEGERKAENRGRQGRRWRTQRVRGGEEGTE